MRGLGSGWSQRVPFAVFAAAILFCACALEMANAAPFQSREPLDCSGAPTVCRATFDEVPDDRRLNVNFVSCFIQTVNQTVANKAAFIGVNNAQNGNGFRHALFAETRQAGNQAITIISQPVNVIVREGQRPDVAVFFSGFLAASGDCSISMDIVVAP